MGSEVDRSVPGVAYSDSVVYSEQSDDGDAEPLDGSPAGKGTMWSRSSASTYWPGARFSKPGSWISIAELPLGAVSLTVMLERSPPSSALSSGTISSVGSGSPLELSMVEFAEFGYMKKALLFLGPEAGEARLSRRAAGSACPEFLKTRVPCW